MLMNVERRSIMSPKITNYEGNFVNDDSDTISDNLHDLILIFPNFGLSVESSDCNDWFIDLEAPIHMSCNKNWLKNFQEKDDGRKIYSSTSAFICVWSYANSIT